MTTNTHTTAINTATRNYTMPLIFLTSLFFMWGFMTSLNDILIPHLRSAFNLNYTQAMLIQFCFFGAYALVSLPAGKLLDRIGYQKGIVAGLVLAGLGCWVFWPAAAALSYPLFLGALFILAGGITILQVSANPYVSALGPAHTASSRLISSQAFNSLGTTIGPWLGGLVILGAVAKVGADASAEAGSVQLPYLGLGVLFMVMAAVFARIKLPVLDIEASSANAAVQDDGKTAWSFPQLKFGIIAIFVYVGGEVAVGSFLINYLGDGKIAGLSAAAAAPYVSYFWGGAMVGRFIGIFTTRWFAPGRVLALHALAAVALVALSMSSTGSVAMWSILAVGLCNSIMFPTIFSLAVSGLGQHTSQGSGLLCMAIVGGALLPVLQGLIADFAGLQAGFILPILCYLYITFYGMKFPHEQQ